MALLRVRHHKRAIFSDQAWSVSLGAWSCASPDWRNQATARKKRSRAAQHRLQLGAVLPAARLALAVRAHDWPAWGGENRWEPVLPLEAERKSM